MRAVVIDSIAIQQLVERRKKLGIDRWDEVWKGEWHLNPGPSIEHQRIVKGLLRILMEVVEDTGLGLVLQGVNVADPSRGLLDFRIPDISIVLQGSRAQIQETFIAGGPDMLIEIRSPGDETYEKLPWYGEQGVREVFILDRDTKRVELYRHDGTALVLRAAFPQIAESQLLQLRFETIHEAGIPHLHVMNLKATQRSWVV